MNKTSLEAYYSVNLQEREKEVLNCFFISPQLTNKQIATLLKWEINRVTGRVNGLVKKGVLEARGTTKINNRSHTVWTLKTKN